MKRQKFSDKMKLDIVLSYVSGEKRVVDICREYGISRTVVHEWLDTLKSRYEWIFCHKKRLDALKRAHEINLGLREENTRLRQRLGDMTFDEGIE